MTFLRCLLVISLASLSDVWAHAPAPVITHADCIAGMSNAGRLTEIKQANGQKVGYTYDDAGRVHEYKEFNAGNDLIRTTTFTFDVADNLTGWSDGARSATRSYDDADRLLSETVNYGEFGLTHRYTYYPNNQLKTYTGPDGVAVSYDYDALGHLQTVTIPDEGALSVTEWQWAVPKKTLLPGGAMQQREFDGYLELTRLKVLHPAGFTVFDLQNQFGKLAELRQTTRDASTSAYGYDDAVRLTSASVTPASGRSETFQYDAAGNRIQYSGTGVDTWVFDAANQLTVRGSVTYTYDDSGNLVRKADSSLPEPARTTHYAYDAFNRLIEVRDGADTVIARYAYDPFDRRLSKTAGGTTTHYLPTPWGLLAEADASGQVQVSYGWNPNHENGTDPLYARVPGTEAGTYRYVYYHNDQLGTPQRLTDQSGAVVWAAEYDAFGRATVSVSADAPLTSNLRYPGQYYDAETGLHYNDRRYYDPQTGRYVTRDPLGFEGGINLYLYAAASPTNAVDPTGEFLPLCLAYNYLRCMATCMGISVVTDLVLDCGTVNWGDNAKDCAIDCVFSMLPIPDPCGKFGMLFSGALGALGGLFSFPEDTLVHVRPRDAADSDAALGRSELKRISEIRPGDQVLSWAEWQDGQAERPTLERIDAKAQSYQAVEEVRMTTAERRLVTITLDSGAVLEATDGHPFRTTEGWRDAILLKKGGRLLLMGDGESDPKRSATIADVRIETRTLTTYNLEVAQSHTFFVGEDGAVVHNGGRGVYFFPEDPQAGALYIGKAANFCDRLGKHRRGGRIKGPPTKINMPNSSENDRRVMESFMTNAADSFGIPTTNIKRPPRPR